MLALAQSNAQNARSASADARNQYRPLLDEDCKHKNFCNLSSIEEVEQDLVQGIEESSPQRKPFQLANADKATILEGGIETRNGPSHSDKFQEARDDF